MNNATESTFERDLLNHTDHFGNDAICQKSGRGWWVSFQGKGFPQPFKTKRQAMEKVACWRLAAYERMTEAK